MTDGRLRDMYSAARTGQPLVELAPSNLPLASAQIVLSAKYAAESEPARQLELMVAGFRRKYSSRLPELQQELAEAKRRGDTELARRLSIEIVSNRK